jgi:mevalonate kinase
LRTFIKLEEEEEEIASRLRLELPDLHYEGSFDGKLVRDSVIHAEDAWESTKEKLVTLIEKEHSQQIVASVLMVLYLFGKLAKREGSVILRVKTELPMGAGLGSSAAYGVCIAAGLLHYFGWLNLNIPEPNQAHTINHWAFIAEKIIHGMPSGIDNTVSTFGKIRS